MSTAVQQQSTTAADEAIRAKVAEFLNTAPPLTPEVKDRISSALRPRPTEAGEAR